MRYPAVAPADLIGQGAMDAVYLAARDDDTFEWQVAIRVLRNGLASAEARRRFDRERRLLARLDHPGICALLDPGVAEDGRACIIMEHVAGAPLDAWIDAPARDGNEPPLRLRLELFLRLCGAVAHAHARGIVHRDVKPANILVLEPGQGHELCAVPEVKLIDFGIARVVDTGVLLSATATRHHLVGTLQYMAPEQVSDAGSTDARADAYALGAVLFQILCGRPPIEIREVSLSAVPRRRRARRSRSAWPRWLAALSPIAFVPGARRRTPHPSRRPRKVHRARRVSGTGPTCLPDCSRRSAVWGPGGSRPGCADAAQGQA